MNAKQKLCQHKNVESKVLVGINDKIEPPYPVFGKVEWTICHDCGLYFTWQNFAQGKFIQLLPTDVKPEN